MKVQMMEADNDDEVDTSRKQSYANDVSGSSKQGVDEVSLQAMDEVIVLDEECVVDNNGPYSSIHFADQVHDRIDYSMRRWMIVRLLGRAIGFKTLLTQIRILWQLQGQYQELSYCSTMESYILHDGIASVANHYLGSFARPSIPKLEYEGLQQICFQCGVYGHTKEPCGVVEGTVTDHVVHSGPTNLSEPVPEENNEGRSTIPNEEPTSARDPIHIIRKEKSSEVGPIGHVSVVAMVDGQVPKVTEQRKDFAMGVIQWKGLKVKKNIDVRIPPPVVLSEWLQSTKHAPQSSKPASHRLGALPLRASGKVDNTLTPVDSMKTIDEEVGITYSENASPNFRRYLCEHYIYVKPKIIALFETHVSGCVTDKVIRRSGFQNSFRVEAHDFSGSIWILWDEGVITIFTSTAACPRFSSSQRFQQLPEEHQLCFHHSSIPAASSRSQLSLLVLAQSPCLWTQMFHVAATPMAS
ncbi:hypothetical protein F3Y22_tig00110336pilonHSYRG00051 [Hibiscus syriacus]|uniref:CCHC-type domain-containing protein n=1 Tax=Hibiscus syriacus TaxID=106335 RepID=A0A6A3B0A0_HIBSY|nr:hypothetical protein F3Y22_tig00110336pilonHSYRG00051 [Hibiscus syriacus]